MTAEPALIVAIAQLILAVASLIGVIVSCLVSLRNGRKTDAVHAEVNGKTQQLLEATATIAHAAGVKEEHERPT